MTNNDIKFEVLVSAMHQKDHSLIEKMNIQSDVIVINQCDFEDLTEFNYKGNRIRFFSSSERGVGLSRNTALFNSASDICLFADDDVVYVKGYKKIIIDAFEQNPYADMIVFNVLSSEPDENRPDAIISKRKRLKWYNSLRYGTVQLAIRTNSAKSHDIHFSLLFGGGAKYSSGEDSLFISDFIKKGLKVYSDPAVIGHVTHGESTWFNGYTDKYFIDKGAFYACLSKKFSKLLCFQFVIRHRNLFNKEKSPSKALKLMIEGTKLF